MSFLEKWNASIIWLRDLMLTPLRTTWDRARQWPVASIIGIIAVLFAFYFYKTPILEFIDHADVGKIVVNSPTVYTRQRLVNDRLDQAHWLRTQLKSTEVGYDQKFNSIDQVRRTVSNTQFKIADAPAETSTDASAEKPSDSATGRSRGTATAEAVSVEGTTMALFRAKNAYREEVRSEITQTELDDRHDIDGNTIFRLTFDASIIAGTRRDSVAVIGVRLQHEPLEKSLIHELYLADYRSLYQDWAEYFQRTLRKSLLSIPKSLLTSEPYPPMRLLFSEFLQRRICQLFLPNGDINKILNESPPECPKASDGGPGDAQKRANDLLNVFTKNRAKTLETQRAIGFNKQLASFSAQKYKISVQDGAFLRDLAISACKASPSGDRIPISNIFIVGPSGKPTLDEIGCPYYDSLKERLLSGVLLYQKLVLMTREERLKWAKPGNDDLSCTDDDCDAKPSILKCFTADFIKASLNVFQDPNAQEQQKIDHFLKLDIVGRGVDDCDLLVSGRIKRYKKADDEALLFEFINYLNSGTDAFAYSVTPKNLTENISTASDTRDAFTAMLRPNNQGNEIASLLKKRSEQNQAIVAHPIVVGFGSGFNISDMTAHNLNTEIKAVRSLDFGWIVAPRSLSERIYEQIDGQYPLTAFISVPAWWRTAHVFINSCWLARRGLADVKLDEPASKLCDQGSKMHTSEIIVRLPPAVPEISRKLAFDVVQQPSLYNPTPKELVIGMPGSLLLEGARLWRSTEVTAGAQHADRITVLPNMEGILAEFDCVRPPTGLRKLRQNPEVESDKEQTVTYEFIQVWTSEGVTDRAPVTFIWPARNSDYLKANALCPDNRPKSGAPSADASSKQSQANLQQDAAPPPPPPEASPGTASATSLANPSPAAASTKPPTNPSDVPQTTSPLKPPADNPPTSLPVMIPESAPATSPPAK
jgi:hypothetical protein